MARASLQSTLLRMANVLVSSKPSRPFTVIVEGNIGSGKTTFLNYFQKFDKICVLSEPIEAWRNCGGHNVLNLMYQDPQKWSFAFQSLVQITMLENHTKKIKQPVKMMERSIYSGRYCFVEKMIRDGLIAKPSGAVLDKWFEWLVEDEKAAVDLIVYLRTSPEVVYDRVLKRSRAEEKTVSLDYLKSLHEFHENWLYNKSLFSCPAPVLILNADLDEAVIKTEYKKCEPIILNGITAQA